jgi:hypothetical protein
MMDRICGLLAVGTELVTRMVNVRVIKSDEVRPLRSRQTQPSDDLLNARFVREVIIEV